MSNTLIEGSPVEVRRLMINSGGNCVDEELRWWGQGCGVDDYVFKNT